MYQLKRRGPVAYEDLLREMEVIEHHLLSENSALAMDLMVLEARIRERFQKMELLTQGKNLFSEENLLGNDFDLDDIQALIPKELPDFPTMGQVTERRRRRRTFETAGMAAALALVTALGVFGLASILQLALSWIA